MSSSENSVLPSAAEASVELGKDQVEAEPQPQNSDCSSAASDNSTCISASHEKTCPQLFEPIPLDHLADSKHHER